MVHEHRHRADLHARACGAERRERAAAAREAEQAQSIEGARLEAAATLEGARRRADAEARAAERELTAAGHDREQRLADVRREAVDLEVRLREQADEALCVYTNADLVRQIGSRKPLAASARPRRRSLALRPGPREALGWLVRARSWGSR